jgi:catechol 2,3-dioxygenase-like lactoylglutathione lyase family enzyme
MSMKMNLENLIVPVTDVDRAKGFYQQLGWRLDDDVAPMDGIRFIQFTPPGSPASIQGTLVVHDIEEAHDGLVKLGIDVSDVWHGPPFPLEARQPGPDPQRTSYGSFCSFNDPDANLWIVQEVTTRLPGRE